MRLWGGGVNVMTKKMGATGVPCGAGSRKRPCRWPGYSKQEPKCVAQGLGEAGEEVTSVGREKRGSKRLSAESEARVCFLVTLMSMMCSAIPAQGAAILCGSAQEKSLPSN